MVRHYGTDGVHVRWVRSCETTRTVVYVSANLVEQMAIMATQGPTVKGRLQSECNGISRFTGTDDFQNLSLISCGGLCGSCYANAGHVRHGYLAIPFMEIQT